MAEPTEVVLSEGPGVLEKLTGETPYRRLVGKVFFVEYPFDQAGNNHLTVIGATDFPISDINRISVNRARRTLEFEAFDGTYLIRPICDADVEWAGEENINDARNGNF